MNQPTLQPGTTVRFATEVDPGDADLRMVVIEDRGDRVLVEATGTGMALAPQSVHPRADLIVCPPTDKWETLCRRTEDPKLAFIERLLAQRGIPSRRNGSSFHAPILEVPAQHLDAAWKMLGEDIFGDGQRLDDIEDDDPVFSEF